MDNSEVNYTVSEIKDAFWSTFHRAGELWFTYFGSPENMEKDTMGYWEEFLKSLQQGREL